MSVEGDQEFDTARRVRLKTLEEDLFLRFYFSVVSA